MASDHDPARKEAERLARALLTQPMQAFDTLDEAVHYQAQRLLDAGLLELVERLDKAETVVSNREAADLKLRGRIAELESERGTERASVEREEGEMADRLLEALGFTSKLFTTDELEAKRQRVLGVGLRELVEAAKDQVEHGPCSDPDCCKTAMENDRASKRLRAALKPFDSTQ